MFFKAKKSSLKALPLLRLYVESRLIYDGLLKDLPLKEEIILQKSVEFFDDPDPCHIHRSAVRVRLVAELEKELQTLTDTEPGPLLLAWADFPAIDRFQLM